MIMLRPDEEVHDHIRYLIFKGHVVPIFKSFEDGLWRDQFGTIIALRDDTATLDLSDRCGIGVFSLSESHELTAYCRPHDYAYSSPAYQVFHTRRQADEYLRDLIAENKKWWWLANPFYWLSRLFGGRAWEHEATR